MEQRISICDEIEKEINPRKMNHANDNTTLLEPASRLLPSEGSGADQGGCDVPLPVIRTNCFQLLVDEKEGRIVMGRLECPVHESPQWFIDVLVKENGNERG